MYIIDKIAKIILMRTLLRVYNLVSKNVLIFIILENKLEIFLNFMVLLEKSFCHRSQ